MRIINKKQHTAPELVGFISSDGKAIVMKTKDGPTVNASHSYHLCCDGIGVWNTNRPINNVDQLKNQMPSKSVPIYRGDKITIEF